MTTSTHARVRLARGGCKAAILASTALGFLALDAGSALAQIESSQVGEVVVTARKREETLVDVPVAVSAIGGAQLARAGTVSLTSIADQIPNMVVVRSASGTGAVISLRGVASPAQDPGLEASVAINVDGVQVSRGLIAQAAFFDLQQVEVLKGPQSLFFGKNSPGGVISLTSVGPGAHWQGFAKAGYEFNAAERFVEGAIGGPVTDTLGVRMAVRYSKMDGYMKNVAPAIPNPFMPQYPLPGNRDWKQGPASEVLVGRLTVDYHPTDKFDATLRILANRYRDNGVTLLNQPVHCGNGVHPVTLGVLDPYSDCKPDQYVSQSNLPDALAAHVPYYSRYNYKPFTDNNTFLTSLRLNYNAGPITFTSVTGSLQLRNYNFGDFSYDSYTQFIGLNYEESMIFTQEVRALSNFQGPVNFAAGVYYEDNKRRTGGAGCGRTSFGPDPVTGYTAGCINDNLVTGKAYSAFGQAILKLHDTIELTAGGRYTKEKKQAAIQNLFVNQVLQPNGLPEYAGLLPVGRVLSGSFDDSNFSPEVTAAWHPTPHSTLYGAYRTGYKSGGFAQALVVVRTATIGQLTFGPEKAKGGEIGYKAEFLDRRLFVDLDVYHYKFSGLQRSSLDIATTTFLIRNAANAITKGVEFNTHFQVTPELMLNGSLNYNKAYYASFPTAACYNGQTTGCAGNPQVPTARTQNLSGTPLARAPEWTYFVGADYTHPVAANWSLGLNGEIRYSGAYLTQDDGDPAARQGAYTRLNATIRLFQPDGHWDFGIVGRNLTNKYVILVTTGRPGGAPGDLSGAIDRPREVVLQGTYRY